MSQLDFLRVNDFLSTEMDVRALRVAMDLGVLGAWILEGPRSLATLSARFQVNPVGLRLLADMLEASGVIARSGDLFDLTPTFRAILPYRDLLEARMEFADLVWPDIHRLFTPLLNDPQQFMARSKVFDLFRYDRCFEINAENLEATRAWTRFTTTLTKYEAGAALDLVDISPVCDFIDMGGNTGEFSRQLCLRNPALRATVLDLPVVCELGRRHIRQTASPSEAARIDFFATDMRDGPLPGAVDLVSFKSVLHDWPDEDAARLIERASALVRPGGRIMIFEREPLDFQGRRVPYVAGPDLVFLHFLRPASLYLKKLEQLGFSSIEHRRVMLDVGFHLITARRPAKD